MYLSFLLAFIAGLFAVLAFMTGRVNYGLNTGVITLTLFLFGSIARAVLQLAERVDRIEAAARRKRLVDKNSPQVDPQATEQS